LKSILIGVELSDFESIVIRTELLRRKIIIIETLDLKEELYKLTSSILDEYEYFNKRREKFLIGQIECNSEEQRQFALSALNNIFYWEDVIRLHIWSKEFNTKHPSHLENFQVEYVKEKLKPFQKNKSGMDSFYELKSDLINWKKYIIKKEFTYDTLPFNLRIRISLPNLPNKVVSNNSIDECERMLLL
jgi:hypothetical protein